MNIVKIQGLDGDGLRPYAGLTEAQLRNRLHPEEGLFICESEKVVRVAIERGVEPVSFLCEEKFLGRVEALTEGSGWKGGPVYVGSREVLRGLTGYTLSRGLLCAMRRPAELRVEEVVRGARRVGVIDGVVNSENTGAIFRAAAALGIDGVMLTRTCCDPLNRRACRVSMGTVFQVPWAYMDTYGQLREAGFKVAALALTDKSVAIDDERLKRCERLAIVMGAEGDGLGREVLEECDYVARIPMQRGVDSLNVAAAAAVAFYEIGKGVEQ